jgi:glycosyltransferase involved in cell wall biosynthesis
MRTASCGLWVYAQRRFDYFRDRLIQWPAYISIPAASIYALVQIVTTPWIEYRLKKTLSLVPCLTLETPQSLRRWQALARRIGADTTRMHFVPHPVQTRIFHAKTSVHKKKQTISVGRWGSYQKNLPALLKHLAHFLSNRRDWVSLVVGSGLPAKSSHPRILFSPPVSPQRLARLMQVSKIFIFSSRYESFCLAAAEALSCGCRVRGPAGVDATDFYEGLAANRKMARNAERFFSPPRVAKELLQSIRPEDF